MTSKYSSAACRSSAAWRWVKLPWLPHLRAQRHMPIASARALLYHELSSLGTEAGRLRCIGGAQVPVRLPDLKLLHGGTTGQRSLARPGCLVCSPKSCSEQSPPDLVPGSHERGQSL